MPDPYLSEIKYLGSATQDFVEIAVDAGADVVGHPDVLDAILYKIALEYY